MGQGAKYAWPRVLRACASLILAAGASIGHSASAQGAQSGTDLREQVCVITDDRLDEVSGLASDGRRWYVVNDGGTQIEVYVLDRDCVVDRVITADTNPYDVEDLALAADGTLWLADIGDNRRQRETVAIHKLAVDGRSAATLHRMIYPDGPHDAEAILLDRSGVPHIVTKEVLGVAGVYRPLAELAEPGPTPLEKVAEVTLRPTDTPGGPVGAVGSILITGGAVSADGTVVALRTYTDAYLYAAPDGDIVAALAREPVRIPLPGEHQGEAIAFEPDGTLLSASEGTGQPVWAIAQATHVVDQPASPRPPVPTTTSDGAAAVVADDNDEPMRVWPMALTAAGVLIAGGLIWAGIVRLRIRT